MSRDVVMIRAEPADLDLVLEILNQAKARLLESGIDIWRSGSLDRERFLPWISQGEVYLAVVDGAPTGTITLQWTDERWWGERPPDAGYVHKLAIRPAYKGNNLGLHMLKWAGVTARAAGKKFLRLNCMAEDPKIRDYYEQAGFLYRGDKQWQGLSASLYEKPLA